MGDKAGTWAMWDTSRLWFFHYRSLNKSSCFQELFQIPSHYPGHLFKLWRKGIYSSRLGILFLLCDCRSRSTFPWLGTGAFFFFFPLSDWPFTVLRNQRFLNILEYPRIYCSWEHSCKSCVSCRIFPQANTDIKLLKLPRGQVYLNSFQFRQGRW